ncbi:cellulose binding domain-containing protein [Solwaraspora sp. WMMD406]|uniref:cellulose binding domain-containing protein n=1 Tax=Solwaraspora sp. WMMD406 TaxID=3016095 RepID=UPI0024169F77|nr:cellulose binding domain-containing protein [Solwaraspora sp. WMMD406]MDG4766732.1 cellulose binding domain-containing protein [Solwaraspora sp. WMMD406]
MPYRVGVLLAAVTIALTASAGAAAAQPTAPATTAPTPGVTCPPALPITGRVTGATPTTLTVSYSMLLVGPPCGYVPPITVTLFASQADAQQWRDPVAEQVSGPDRHGDVTLAGLTPDTEYWFRFSDAEGRRDTYVVGGPAWTLPVATCTATATLDASWGTGFVATVTVRNAGVGAIEGWRVSWRWAGDERIQTAWNGVVTTDGAAVTVANAGYNGAVAAGGTASFGMVVSTNAAPTALPAMTCTS